MRNFKAKAWHSGALAGMVMLTACGGSSSDAGTAASASFSAEGVYGGMLGSSNTLSLSLQMLVLETGELWALYGQDASGQLLVSGFIQGGTSTTATGMRSTDLRDFATAPPAVLNLSASVGTAAGTLAGTLATSTGSASLSVGPIAGSLYRYDAPALPTAVQGDWTLTTLQGEVHTVTVAADGSLTASGLQGCNFTGRVLPRASGKNVYDVTLTFGPAPCVLANQPATGIALTYPLANGSNQLLVAVHDAGRTVGTAAFGAR